MVSIGPSVGVHLAGWKGDPAHRWPGRQIIAVLDGQAVGHVEFYLHSDNLALQVVGVQVHLGFRKRGLAFLLMDRLYEAHPDAWINHGLRTDEGARWWHRYRDPAPERNVHNRPPAEWAACFLAPGVDRGRAANRVWNQLFALDGHQGAEHRYGQRLEEEYQRHTRSCVPDLGRPRADPLRQRLYAGQVVCLSPGTAPLRARPGPPRRGAGPCPARTHRPRQPPPQRWPHRLLEHHRPQCLRGHAPGPALQGRPAPSPATHLVYQTEPPAGSKDDLPQHRAGFTYVDHTDPGDIPLALTGLSWRRGSALETLHHTAFDVPVQAAIAPDSPGDALSYRARYDEAGRLRPSAASPFEERSAEIRQRADAIIQASVQRSRHGVPEPARSPGFQPGPSSAGSRL